MSLESYSKYQPSSIDLRNSIVYTLTSRYGDVVETASDTSSSSVDTSSRLDGFKNSAYASQISKGANATTPLDAYDRQLLVVDPAVIDAEIGYPDGSIARWKGSWSTGLNRPAAHDLSLLDTVTNKAITKVYTRLSSDSKLLQVLGELGETIHLIRQPCLLFRYGVSDYLKVAETIRKRWAKARNVAAYGREISELWLTYSFGWKPLMMDINAGIAAFQRQLQSDVYQNFRVSYSDKSASSGFVGNFSPTTGPIVHVTFNDEYECGVVIAGKARIKLSVNKQVAQFSGTLPDFIPAAWELAPWSFLIDYFINIGDILECWAVAQNHDVSVSSITSRQISKATSKADVRGYTPQLSNYSKLTGSGSATLYLKTITRRVPSSLPFPSLSKNAHWTVPRALNVLALITLRKADSKFSLRE